jgi:hypothetical protein
MKIFSLIMLAFVGCASNGKELIACQGSPFMCYELAHQRCGGDWHQTEFADFNSTTGVYRLYVKCGE